MTGAIPVMIVMPVTAGVIINTERTPAPAQPKVPSAPWVVVDIEAPCAEAGVVIIRGDPGTVVPACAIENSITIDVTSGITRGITDINDTWCTFIYVYILCVVNG
jgi:hypothetical protein